MLTHSQKEEHDLLQTLGFITAIAMFFVIGIFIGEAYTSIERIPKLLSGLSIVLAIVLGGRILVKSIHRKKILMTSSVLTILLSNMVYSFLNLNQELYFLFFNLANILAMVTLYKHCHHKE